PPLQLYTLSLHDALPIWTLRARAGEVEGEPTLVDGQRAADEEGLIVELDPSLVQVHAGRDLPDTRPEHAGGEPPDGAERGAQGRSEEHTSELQSRFDLVC